MKIAPLPHDEDERLAALEEYQILDTAAENIFDNITDVASRICGVPICLLSLIDKDRQWFKSNKGLPNTTESSRDSAFCAHAILDSKLMEIPDATKDQRFHDNPFVTGNPNVRFYAGMPLINPQGFKLGTLCVIDQEPKSLTNEQKEILKSLAEVVIQFFEIKKAILNDLKQRRQASRALSEANQQLKIKLLEQKQSRHDLILLSEMSSVLQTCMTADEAYTVIGKFCHQIFPDTKGALFLLHINRDHIERALTWGDDVAQQDFYTTDDCWALRRSQAHYVEDAKHDLICKHMACYPETPSYMCIPLIAQGETLGLLSIEFSTAVNDQEHKIPISETQRLLVLAMAEQAALALANVKLRETLQHQSMCDPLTGLYNRRHLNETLKHELPQCKNTNSKAAFLLIDIDHFKKFNDSYGHDAGDLVLIQTAQLLSSIATKNHGVAYRLGGEEFLLVLKNISTNEASLLADELREEMQQQQLRYHGISLDTVTLSIGVAVFPLHGQNREEVMAAADAALYRAKESGRNKAVVATQ